MGSSVAKRPSKRGKKSRKQTEAEANAAASEQGERTTGATNEELHCYWADDNVLGMADADSSVDGQTVRMRGIAPTASKWLYMKVEMQDRGSGLGVRATFLAVTHTGASVERVFNTSGDRDVALCYYVCAENRDTGTPDVYIKGTNWEQTIPNM